MARAWGRASREASVTGLEEDRRAARERELEGRRRQRRVRQEARHGGVTRDRVADRLDEPRDDPRLPVDADLPVVVRPVGDHLDRPWAVALEDHRLAATDLGRAADPAEAGCEDGLAV